MTSCPRCHRPFEDGVRFCPVDGALVVPVMEDRHLGQLLLGQFELLEVCGRGAMGTVYRAHQRTMDRTVAVKILRRDLLQEPAVLKRFLREARAAARLGHPNIVTVHLVGETDDGVPYLVMEYIDGAALEAICEAQGAQPVARTLHLTRQIASALGEAHHLGIVHRDLKPANILVSDRSRVPDLVKVLDFGIAKIVQGEGAAESLITRDGTIFGTPHYIAPEQASGSDIDHRADLYSLGVILFRLALGRLPFQAASGMQVVLQHMREPPPRPRHLDASLPEPLEDLILACLAKERSRRPKDALAIVGEIDRIEARLAHSNRTLLGLQMPSPPAAPEAPAPPAARPATRPSASKGRVAMRTAKVMLPKAASEPVERPARNRRTALVTALIGGGAAAGALFYYYVYYGFGRLPFQHEPSAPEGVLEAAHSGAPRDQPQLRPTAPPAAPATAAAEARALPEPDDPPLASEHSVREQGATLRAGFERPPTPGRLARLAAVLISPEHDLHRARVEMALRAPTGREQPLSVERDGDRYVADYLFRGAGVYQVRVRAQSAGVTALTLVFDVDVPRRPVAANRGSRERRASGEDLPITVIPAEPIRPRLIGGGAARTPAPAPVAPAPSEASAPPAAIVPPAADALEVSPATDRLPVPEPRSPAAPGGERRGKATARPAQAPSPARGVEQEEPAASPPPPPPDPTTLPPPSPEPPIS